MTLTVNFFLFTENPVFLRIEKITFSVILMVNCLSTEPHNGKKDFSRHFDVEGDARYKPVYF